VDRGSAETREVDQVQLVRDGIDAWNRGDWEAALDRLHEDIEWRISQPLFDMPVLSHGHDGVREFWRRWAEPWEQLHVEPERMVPIEGGVAAFVRWRARGRDGVEVDQQVVFVFMADEEDSTLTRRFIAYWDPDEAVEELHL
jgi:ketosteroid isomerase-like protein